MISLAFHLYLFGEFEFGKKRGTYWGVDRLHLEAEFPGDVAIGAADLLALDPGDGGDLLERAGMPSMRQAA